MLTQEQIEKNFEEFIGLIENNIKRDGVDKLVVWLKNKDTKTAPASGKYHCAYEGGLVEHSLNVYRRLKKLLQLEYPRVLDGVDNNGVEKYKETCPYSDETITLVSLLHDISKIGYYEIGERNVKDEKGNWTKAQFYQAKDQSKRLLFESHSENSLYMTSKFLKLEYEEELAIRYHMGGFDSSEGVVDTKNISAVYAKCPLALLLHTADICCTYIDEKGGNE